MSWVIWLVILVLFLLALAFFPGPKKSSRDRFPDNLQPGAGCHCDYQGPNKEPPA